MIPLRTRKIFLTCRRTLEVCAFSGITGLWERVLRNIIDRIFPYPKLTLIGHKPKEPEGVWVSAPSFRRKRYSISPDCFTYPEICLWLLGWPLELLICVEHRFVLPVPWLFHRLHASCKYMLKGLAPCCLNTWHPLKTSMESDCEESLTEKSEYKALVSTLMYLNEKLE